MLISRTDFAFIVGQLPQTLNKENWKNQLVIRNNKVDFYASLRKLYPAGWKTYKVGLERFDSIKEIDQNIREGGTIDNA